jgi:TIR domain
MTISAFVQHDQIKEEIAKNSSFFERLIRCATDKKYHVGLVLRISLEIIWILTFNGRIREILIKQYDSFLNYVKTVLYQWNEERVRVAAKGILWKLENESIFKTQMLNQNIDPQSPEKYDLMISYSHSNKELCHQIHQSLIELKYRVWIDLENMHGSTFQSMAQGIEASEMILVCMSNPYKQSAYCQSEAEYAYTRRRHIIPLLLEKKYRPDGWLGLICGSKLYVDFTKGEFEQAVHKLIGQIQLYQRRSSTNVTIKLDPQPLSHEIASIVDKSKNANASSVSVRRIYCSI